MRRKMTGGLRPLEGIAAIALTTTMLTVPVPSAYAQDSTTQLETITVQGGVTTTVTPGDTGEQDGGSEPTENAWGPVDGYVATRSGTGTKTDTPLRQIPQSISVVTRDEIRDMGAQTLQETVRYTAGVVADGYGLDGRTDSILIRGTDATQYLDGLRRTFDYYIYDYRVDPYFMERIEVLRGPASVLYGQAAVGGIVNSVSKRPQQEKYGEITAEYGTFDFKQIRFDFTGPASEDRRWSYRLTGLARDADTQVNYVEDDRLAIQPALTFAPQTGTSITLLAHLQKDHSGSTQQFFPHVGTIFPNVSGDFIPWDSFVGEPGDKYDTEAASGTLIIEHEFNETFKLQSTTRYTDINNVYNSTYSGFFYTGTPYLNAAETEMARYKLLSDTDTQIFNSDTNVQVKFETGSMSHKLLTGFDYADFRAQRMSGGALNTTPFNVYDPVYGLPENLVGVTCDGAGPVALAEVPVCEQPDQHVTQAGLYVQDQMNLGNWIAVVGARRDTIENSVGGTPGQRDGALSVRAGLMYEFDFGLTPYVSYAESFVPVVGTTVDGQTFDPQQGEMIEVGFKYQPGSERFVINGSLYDIVESNRLTGDPNNPGFSVQTGEVTSRGFEIEALGQVTDTLKVSAAYSYTDAKYSSGGQTGFRVASVPENLASLWAVKEFSLFGKDGFSVGGGVRYVGASWDGTDTLETPGYTLYDAMVAYETDEWRFQVNGTNLGDKEYLTTCLSRGDCFRGTSRTIIAGVTRKF